MSARGDVRLRELERLARHGDLDAMRLVHLERVRLNLPLLPDFFDTATNTPDPWFLFPQSNITTRFICRDTSL
jgi:hypothetical protein